MKDVFLRKKLGKVRQGDLLLQYSISQLSVTDREFFQCHVLAVDIVYLVPKQ